MTIDILNIHRYYFLLENINWNIGTQVHKFMQACGHEMSLVSAFDQCSAVIAWALCCSIEDRCHEKKWLKCWEAKDISCHMLILFRFDDHSSAGLAERVVVGWMGNKARS